VGAENKVACLEMLLHRLKPCLQRLLHMRQVLDVVGVHILQEVRDAALLPLEGDCMKPAAITCSYTAALMLAFRSAIS